MISTNVPAIFEGAFVYDDILFRVDILKRNYENTVKYGAFNQKQPLDYRDYVNPRHVLF